MLQHILIVEDEKDLSHLMRDYLEKSNYKVSCLYDGDDVMPFIESQTLDLVLLDLMLPNKDGISLCRDIRAVNKVIPIIITTAKVEEIDRLLGLEMGADDYVCKPYSPREVVARVKSIFRRMQLTEDEVNKSFKLNSDTLSVMIGDDSLQLTNLEYQLLTVLMRRSGKIFSRQSLMDTIYSDYRVVSDRTIDSHIKKLRKKLSGFDSLGGQELIISVYGAGYKFEYPRSI